MDPTNKPQGPSPHYSLYQRECFRAGGERGQLPSFSVHPEELVESTKSTLNNRGYFYANSNAGLGWTDRANRCAHQVQACNAKLEQSEARCAQECANAASLWDTAEDYPLQLEAERNESESWKTKKASMEHELAQLKRKVDDARCSVCDSVLTSAT